MQPSEDEKLKQVEALRDWGRLGAALARWGGVLLCLAPLLPGCLVTDRIEFEVERNVPPVILDKPGTEYPIGEIVWIDRDPPVDPSTAPNEWSFDVTVRDENVRDELEARLRVRTDREPNPDFTPNQVVQQTGAVNRTFKVTVDLGQLRTNECHRVELVVSGSFLDRSEPLFFDVAQPPEDIGEASWIVWEGNGNPTPAEAQAILSSCDAVDDFLEAAQ